MSSKYITTVDGFQRAIVVDATDGTRETRQLEFKGRYNIEQDGQTLELRKDIVSLANTRGGALVVGVNESNEKGYRRATSLSDPDVEKTMSWISNTLGSGGVHPTPIYSYAPLIIHHDGVSTEILVVNVEPYPAAIGGFPIGSSRPDNEDAGADAATRSRKAVRRFLQEALLYPVRNDFGVRFLRADEVAAEMTAAHTRRIAIAVDELATPNQKVYVSSPVFMVRREHQHEYHHRLRHQHGITTWQGTEEHAHAPRSLVEVPSYDVHTYVHAIEPRQIVLGIGSQLVALPFGVIREVWKHPDGPLGVLLDCDILVPHEVGMRAALRSR